MNFFIFNCTFIFLITIVSCANMIAERMQNFGLEKSKYDENLIFSCTSSTEKNPVIVNNEKIKRTNLMPTNHFCPEFFLCFNNDLIEIWYGKDVMLDFVKLTIFLILNVIENTKIRNQKIFFKKANMLIEIYSFMLQSESYLLNPSDIMFKQSFKDLCLNELNNDIKICIELWTVDKGKNNYVNIRQEKFFIQEFHSPFHASFEKIFNNRTCHEHIRKNSYKTDIVSLIDKIHIKTSNKGNKCKSMRRKGTRKLRVPIKFIRSQANKNRIIKFDESLKIKIRTIYDIYNKSRKEARKKLIY